MQKIIWVFGESATGKKTLIESLLSDSNSELSNSLNINGKKIRVIEDTISNNLSSFDDEDNELNRQKCILKEIADFVSQKNDEILLIKGQSNDMDDRYGNTLKQFAISYPDIDKEIFLLEVSDMDLLYERIINKDWFQADFERYSKMFPREWVDKAIQKHHNHVCSYIDYGFKIIIIDSTNGFKVVNNSIGGAL
ncbi:MAG: hypothetical protein J1F35_05085 [Erysipelotrichales bacterium]|nr:hypothetical protein [Erysipelotrichales bacterium]